MSSPACTTDPPAITNPTCNNVIPAEGGICRIYITACDEIADKTSATDWNTAKTAGSAIAIKNILGNIPGPEPQFQQLQSCRPEEEVTAIHTIPFMFKHTSVDHTATMNSVRDNAGGFDFYYQDSNGLAYGPIQNAYFSRKRVIPATKTEPQQWECEIKYYDLDELVPFTMPSTDFD